MNTRTTLADVNAALGHYSRALDSFGIARPGLELQTGSKANGRAYRLYIEGGKAAPGTQNGFLGWTKTEAFDTLLTMARTIEDVAYCMSGEQS